MNKSGLSGARANLALADTAVYAGLKLTTDIRWIMKENLKKDRLVRMDAAWVQSGIKQTSA